MSYKLLKVLPSTDHQYWVVDEEHFYVNATEEQVLSVYDLQTLELKSQMDFKFCNSLKKVGTRLMTHKRVNGTPYTHFVDWQTKTIEPCLYNDIYIDFSDPFLENTSLVRYRQEEKSYSGVFDWGSQEILWIKSGFGPMTLFTSLYVLNTSSIGGVINGYLTCYARMSGEEVWSLDMSKLGKEGDVSQIVNLLGVVEDLVVLGVETPSPAVIALDVHTGETRWRVGRTAFTNREGFSYPHILYNMDTNENQTRLYGFRNSYFLELDIQTGQVLQFEDLASENSPYLKYGKKDIWAHTMRYHEGSLVFTSGVHRRSDNIVGGFNIERKEITWLQNMKFKEYLDIFGAGAFPIFTSNRFFIGANYSICIFEKE